MTTLALDIAPVSGVIGAEVHGLDLAGPLSDETVAAVRRAFNEHQVLFFRDQHLTPGAADRRSAVASASSARTPTSTPTRSTPRSSTSSPSPTTAINFGGGWHTDVTFLAEPDLGSILYAVELPPFGGDTLFSSQLAAYDALSDTMKGLLDGLVGIHSAGPQYGGAGYSTQSTAMATKGADAAAASRVEHPVVTTHPETGRRGLYVNPAFTVGIKGMRSAGVQGAARLPVPARPGRGVHVPAALAARAPWRCGTTAASSTTPCTTTAATAG